jgi:hypothetical protein
MAKAKRIAASLPATASPISVDEILNLPDHKGEDAVFTMTDPTASPQAQLMLAQQSALLAHFQSGVPLTLASFTQEITLVARAAAAEAQYGPAAKLYELAGKNIGAIDNKADVHQHVHLHNQATLAEFSRASDESLRQVVHEAKLAREARDAAAAIAP